MMSCHVNLISGYVFHHGGCWTPHPLHKKQPAYIWGSVLKFLSDTFWDPLFWSLVVGGNVHLLGWSGSFGRHVYFSSQVAHVIENTVAFIWPYQWILLPVFAGVSSLQKVYQSQWLFFSEASTGPERIEFLWHPKHHPLKIQTWKQHKQYTITKQLNNQNLSNIVTW